MPRRAAAFHVLVLSLPAGVLTACASGPTVTFRVESRADAASPSAAVPVEGAFVHVAPIAMSEVPLPVNLDTLAEAGSPGASGVTNQRGEITLSLSIDRPHDIAVTPPFTVNDPAHRHTWRGRLNADGTLQPIQPTPGLNVSIPGAKR